jgi:hypothetical protein
MLIEEWRDSEWIVGNPEVMARIRFVGITSGLPVARPKTWSGFCEALDLALDANFPGA